MDYEMILVVCFLAFIMIAGTCVAMNSNEDPPEEDTETEIEEEEEEEELEDSVRA